MRGGSDPRKPPGRCTGPMTSPNSSFLVSSFPFSQNAVLTRAARGQVGAQSDPGAEA